MPPPSNCSNASRSLTSNLSLHKENTLSVTTLDQKTALIIIDLQKGIVCLPTVHPSSEVVKQASAAGGSIQAAWFAGGVGQR